MKQARSYPRLTITRKAAKSLQAGHPWVYADEVIDAEPTENGAVVYGTPWDGKHHLSTNAAVPLKAVCLLARSPHNSICEVTPSEAYPALLMQVYRPADSAAMQRTVLLLDRLLSSVSLFRLRCNMEAEAARIAFEAMKG